MDDRGVGGEERLDALLERAGVPAPAGGSGANGAAGNGHAINGHADNGEASR